ncbi:MAG TPA: nitrogenase component 1 [Polyangia bacterium]
MSAPPAARAGAAPGEVDWSDRVSLSFTIGVYLAINALRDAYLVVDAPDCAHLKTQFVQGNHDWLSTLASVNGVHRVANTDLHPWKMVPARDDSIESLLQQMADYAGAGVVLITSMPMATITGVDYDRLTRRVSAAAGKPVVNIPGDALDGDWLDGYAATLKALARTLDVGGGRPAPDNVAVVGYLMDRNEGDHQANLREMERLLGGLGLNVVSVWLSGKGVADLTRVRDAAAIVSLPYAREAAEILARRLHVPLIDTALPVGLAATERWLRQVAEAFGRSDRVEPLLEQELRRAAPLAEFIIPYQLLHRAMVFVGDPHLGCALDEMAEEIGVRVERHLVLARRSHCRALLARCGAERVTIDPKRNTLSRLVSELLGAGRCDLLVTNSTAVSPGPCPAAIVELGFPSYFTHALDDRPFLFGRGFAVLVERMANELRRAELLTSNPNDRGR